MIVNHENVIRAALDEAMDQDDSVVSSENKKFVRSLTGRFGKRRRQARVFYDLAATMYIRDMELRKGQEVPITDELALAPEVTGVSLLGDLAQEEDGEGRPILDFLRYLIDKMVENDFAFIKWFFEALPKLIEAIAKIFM